MKSVKLKAVSITNYKNIAKLSQEVNGNSFIVFGKNRQGKTSLMEVINRSSLRIEPRQMADLPIKIGAKNAQTGIIYLIEENGKRTEILVDTVYRPSGTVMKVIDLANNGELKPPVERLQSLIGESHDISPLMDMNGKEQFEFLLKVLGGNQAATNFEKKYDEKYQERKVLNKQIATSEANLKVICPDIDIIQANKTTGEYGAKKPLPDQPLKDDLTKESFEAKAHNERVERAIEREKEIESQIAELKEKLKTAKEWIKANPKIDMAAIDKKVADFDLKLREWQKEKDEVTFYNNTVDVLATYLTKKSELEAVEKTRDAVKVEMDAIAKQMRESVSSLKIEDLVPELKLVNDVDADGKVTQGLFYKEDDVNLLPFNRRQISYGKMLVALVKLSSFVNAEKLNIFHIPAWESLDEDSRAEILKFAEDNEDLNLQFAIEEVKQELLGIKLIDKNFKDE